MDLIGRYVSVRISLNLTILDYRGRPHFI